MAPLIAEGTTASAQAIANLRVGMRYGTTAVPSANLQNRIGYGGGFEFGYFSAERVFVPIGAKTSEGSISILTDRNSVWHPAATTNDFGEYREGASGVVVVGAFHIQLNESFESFDQAGVAANAYEDAFVKFDSGQFFVSVGNYTSRNDANSALSSRGFGDIASVNSGTQHTVVITQTGTNNILFEFDYGGTHQLGVMPLPIGGETPETWFRGNRYHGGFEIVRNVGEFTVLQYLDIEDYTKGVVPYEMGNTWPIEALKAQAVCARSYAFAHLNRHRDSGFDICTTVHCQVYRGRASANERSDQAVDETANVYMMYNGRVVQAYYAASNGGASENVENVWLEAVPYLRGVLDPYEADVADRIRDYEWVRTYTPQQIADRLRSRGHSVTGTIVSMRVSEHSPTGNVVSVTMRDSGGRELTFRRREQLISALGVVTQRFIIGNAVLGVGGIYVNSPAQAVEQGSQSYMINGDGEVTLLPGGTVYAITDSDSIVPVTGEGGGASGGSDTGLVNGVFTITGWGNGHNVGMSQWGAYSMAMYHNKNYVDILTFYFTGVTIG